MGARLIDWHSLGVHRENEEFIGGHSDLCRVEVGLRRIAQMINRQQRTCQHFRVDFAVRRRGHCSGGQYMTGFPGVEKQRRGAHYWPPSAAATATIKR